MFCYKMYEGAMIRKRHNQKEIPAPKTEVGKINRQLDTYTKKIYCKPSEQPLPNRRPLSYLKLNKIRKRTSGANSAKNQHQEIKQLEPHQKYRIGMISNIKLLAV